MVNDQPIFASQILRNDDKIMIGSAQITFQGDTHGTINRDSRLSAPANLTGAAKVIEFYCTCGAKIRAKAGQSGRRGICRRCHQEVIIPNGKDGDSTGERPPGNASSVMEHSKGSTGDPVNDICGYCRCEIEAMEVRFPCNACGLSHHEECWNENFGCSAYGCRNVNVLKAGPDIDLKDLGRNPNSEDVAGPGPVTAMADPLPWAHVFLVASALNVLPSIFLFGVPSSLTVVAIGVWLLRCEHKPKPKIILFSYLVCTMALILGVWVSFQLYIGNK
jgi:hypothetical protein